MCSPAMGWTIQLRVDDPGWTLRLTSSEVATTPRVHRTDVTVLMDGRPTPFPAWSRIVSLGGAAHLSAGLSRPKALKQPLGSQRMAPAFTVAYVPTYAGEAPAGTGQRSPNESGRLRLPAAPRMPGGIRWSRLSLGTG
jgi:hypothetical protein